MRTKHSFFNNSKPKILQPTAVVATTDYFGNVQSDGSIPSGVTTDFYLTRYWVSAVNLSPGLKYTCPGSGNRTLQSLGIWGHTRGSPHSELRLAIYNTDFTLRCQGSAVILANNASDQWWEHTTFTGNTTLVGGGDYLFGWSLSTLGGGSNFAYGQTTGTGNEYWVQTGDVATGGFPSTFDYGTAGGFGSPIFVIRAAVL